MANLKVLIKKTNDENYEINTYNGLDEVVSHSQSTAQPKEIFYGVVASEGSFSAIDNNGEIRRLIENGELQISNARTTITESNGGQAEHISIDSDYTEDNVYSVQLTDKLANWDKINYNGRALSSATNLYVVLSDILTAVGYGTAQIDQMLTETIFVGNSLLQNAVKITIKDYLQAITVQYPYLKKSTLKQAIQKVCEVAQLNVYLDNNGNVKFTSARPKAVSTGVCQNISPSMQMELPKKDVLLKNKYDGIELDEVSVLDIVKYYQTAFIDKKNSEELSIDQVDGQFKSNREPGKGQTNIYAGIGYVPYYTFVFFYIPKKSNMNLNEIVNLFDGVDTKGNPYISYSVICEVETYLGQSQIPNSFDRNNISQYFTTLQSTDEETIIFQNFSDSYSWTEPDIISHTVSVTFDLENQSTNINKGIIVYDTQYDWYACGLHLLVGLDEIKLKATGSSSAGVPAYWDAVQGKKYRCKTLEVNFMGDVRTISFDELQSASINVANAQTVAKLPHNELLQATATYNGVKMSQIIANNVLDDYENGIPTSIVKAFALDGVAFKVGDYVQVSKDGIATPLYERADGKRMLFKVTGVNFVYNGFTSQELELQAVNDKEYDNPIVYVLNSTQTAYNIGYGGENKYLNGITLLFPTPQELTISSYKNLPISQIKEYAFYNIKGYYNNTDKIKPLNILTFTNINTLYLSKLSIVKIAKKIVFDCKTLTTLSVDSHCIALNDTIIEFTSNLEQCSGFIFGSGLEPGQNGKGIFIFRHSINQNIEINLTNSSKFAVVVTIYADNEIVKNYDWSSVNITATIKPLSEWVE